ncbi:MAG: hypothetical protein HY902_10785 [Deltaproteobacteria bacterium]|nr:hypothetical protein [Deltaproteobacteria bacterium]
MSLLHRAGLWASALAPLLAATLAMAAEPPVVYVQPLQPAPSERALAEVVAALQAFYPVQVRVLPAQPLPKAAWYAPRKRWRAEVLLDWLAAHMPVGATKVIGMTAADISTRKGAVADWGVLGLGTMDGKSCVISSFRTTRGVSEATARERLAKTAVHELGHNYDLDHCPNVGCLMEDARGKVATVDGESDLCSACRAKLAARGVNVPAKPAVPWRAPSK